MFSLKWALVFLIILIIGGMLAGPIMSRVEQPYYQVLRTENNIEIRQYQPMLIAEVTIADNRERAINLGFRQLADYIFGNNRVKQNIKMTAPVQQQRNMKIAMTAPVQQQAVSGNWQVSFVMPAEYTIKTLPMPVNENVIIKKIPAKQFVVIRFSGFNSDKNIQMHEKILLEYTKRNKLSVTGNVKYAYYNPPWTLPPLRRNELMLELLNPIEDKVTSSRTEKSQ